MFIDQNKDSTTKFEPIWNLKGNTRSDKDKHEKLRIKHWNGCLNVKMYSILKKKKTPPENYEWPYVWEKKFEYKNKHIKIDPKYLNFSHMNSNWSDLEYK